MPALSEQHRLLGQTFTAPHVVIRLLTPLGLAHEKAVERYAPYDRIIAVQPRMRQDTTALVQQCVSQGKSAFVLVNNRAEGCSPLTIPSLVAGLRVRVLLLDLHSCAWSQWEEAFPRKARSLFVQYDFEVILKSMPYGLSGSSSQTALLRAPMVAPAHLT
jgi:hypothetical protein